MVTRTVTIDETEFVLRPLTRREFKNLQPPDETTMEKTLALALDAAVCETLDDLPLYVSRQLFDEAIDLTSGGKAIKNS